MNKTDPKTKLWYFENFKLLDALSYTEKEKLSEMSKMKLPQKWQIINFSNSSADKIYFIKEGKVKISTYSEDGQEIILAILGPGEIFGEMGIIEQNTGSEVAEMMEKTVLCETNIDYIKNILERNPEFNLEIIKLIGLRFKKIQRRLESTCFKDTTERIKELIKDLAGEYGKKETNGEVLIELNLTHEDIAKLTATRRQTVTTILSELEKRGIIKYERKKILLKDISKL